MSTAADRLVLRQRRQRRGWFVDLADPGAGPDTGVSWTTIVEVPVRIGGATVLAGGIGGVGTLEACRRRGYSRRVMEGCVALMQRQRYGLSLLHGIQDYYHRFGYVTCMPEHEVEVTAAAVLGAARPRDQVRLRPLRRADLPAVTRLYNRENGARTGSVPRDPRRFAGFPRGTWWTFKAGARVAVDDGDRVVGYVVYDEVTEHCRASEVGGASAAAGDAIARFLARRARRLGHERFSVFGPPDHPFALYARRYGLRLRSRYPRNAGPMGRVVDLEVCLRSVAPELARRWGREDRDLALTLRTDVGSVCLRWEGEELRVEAAAAPATARAGATPAIARLGQQELTLLLLGYARPEDLRHRGAARIPTAARDLTARLFPLQEAHMWWADRF